MSRIPPKMSAEVVRKLLSKRFEIERIYFEKEPDAATKARQRYNGGKKEVLYKEGWIEFARKKDAKMAALALNN